MTPDDQIAALTSELADIQRNVLRVVDGVRDRESDLVADTALKVVKQRLLALFADPAATRPTPEPWQPIASAPKDTETR